MNQTHKKPKIVVTFFLSLHSLISSLSLSLSLSLSCCSLFSSNPFSLRLKSMVMNTITRATHGQTYCHSPLQATTHSLIISLPSLPLLSHLQISGWCRDWCLGFGYLKIGIWGVEIGLWRSGGHHLGFLWGVQISVDMVEIGGLWRLWAMWVMWWKFWDV